MNDEKVNTGNKKSLILIAIATAMAWLFVLSGVNAQSMNKDKYVALNENIKLEYQASKKRCEPLTKSDASFCQLKAEAARNIARAELEADFKPTIQNRYNANMIEASANYAVASKQCEIMQQQQSITCKQLTKETYAKDTANARSIRNIEKYEELNKGKTVVLNESYAESYKQFNEQFNNQFNEQFKAPLNDGNKFYLNQGFNTIYRVIA